MLDRSARFPHSAPLGDNPVDPLSPSVFHRTRLPLVDPTQSVLDQCTDLRISDIRRVPRRHGFQLFRSNG